MPKSNSSINTDLDNLLDSHGYDVITLDSSGKQTPTPEDADLMQFHFHKDGDDYGTVTVTIDGLKNMIVYYDDKIASSGTELSESDSDDMSWPQLTRQLKKFAQRHQLGFKLKDTDRLGNDMKRRTHAKKLDESYYGNKKISYSDDTPTVKMIIKHNKQLEETDQRFRHIERIFLETSHGERFAVDTNKPSRARMFARHLAEGGEYKDSRWTHLQEINEDLDALSGFVRATKGKEQFNESAQRMIAEAAEKYSMLRETAKRLSSSKGYNNYFESYQPSVITETENSELSEMFKHTTLDNRIERALPVLNKFNISMGKLEESTMFEQWAEGIVDEALNPHNDAQLDDLVQILSDPDFTVGPNADNAIGRLSDIIESDELYDELRLAAEQDSNNDARPVVISWMQRQNTADYKRILDDLDELDSEESEKLAEPENQEPEVPEPDAPQPAPAQGGLPPLPPLAESEFVRILKLSGL